VQIVGLIIYILHHGVVTAECVITFENERLQPKYPSWHVCKAHLHLLLT